jgi:MFS family permease
MPGLRAAGCRAIVYATGQAKLPGHGLKTARQIALALYTGYNIAATVMSFPAGHASDRLGRQGPLFVVAAGVVAFLASYVLFGTSGAVIVLFAVAFLAAGVGIGCAETAEHAASSPSPRKTCEATRSACLP